MELGVKCDTCDASLKADMSQASVIDVEICPDCLSDQRDEAYKKGYDEGYEAGLADGTV